MNVDTKTWPLQFVFIFALIGSAVGLVDPTLFDGGNPPGRMIPYVLVVIAILSASILYFPLFRGMYRIAAGMGDPKNPAEGTLLACIGKPINPNAGTLLDRMGRIETLLGGTSGTAVNLQAGGSLLDRMGRLETLLEALGTPIDPKGGTLLARIGNISNPEDGTLLARVGRLEALTVTLGTPADPEPGTLLARIEMLEKLCQEYLNRRPKSD